MLKERSVLEENLIEPILKVKKEKKVVDDIKRHLADNYQIVDTQLWLNNPEELKSLDIRGLILFTEQIFSKSGNMSINPELFFTPSEIKEARQYSGVTFGDKIELPYTIPNALQLSGEEYVCILEASEINKLMKSNILYYNMDIQREAKVVKRKDKVIVTPTINSKSVKEITQNLLNGKQFPSELKFNAAIGSAESGDELIYDPKHLELTINKQVRLDILDGMHRIRAIENAFSIDPNIKQKFTISITNYSTRQAQLAQAQIAKQNKFSKQRIQELEQSRYSDMVVKELRSSSDLKISQTNRVRANELVSYNVIADSIDEQFEMNSKLDSMEVSDYLMDFFTYLLGSFPSEFLHNIEETRKVSLINDNNMFGYAYITLARRMRENDIKPKEIKGIVNQINFNRDNPLWKELGILNENQNIADTNKARKAIRNYFEKLDIGVAIN